MKFESLIHVVAFTSIASALTGVASAQTTTDRLRASLTIASDYVHNGLLQTNNHPSLRLSADYEHQSGFFAGATLSNVDYVAESRLSNPRESEATVYAGLLWRREQWQTNVTVSHYLYPDFERDYDYSYASATVSYRDRYFLSAAYGSDYLDRWDRTKQVSAGIALPWIQNLEFSASAGRIHYGGRFSSSFSYWNMGLSRPFDRFAIDLRLHDNTSNRNNIGGNQTRGQWVISMNWPLLPRQQ